MQSSKDSIYANPLGEITAFKFDEAVVDDFPENDSAGFSIAEILFQYFNFASMTALK